MVPGVFPLILASADILFPAGWSIYLPTSVSQEMKPPPCPVTHFKPGLEWSTNISFNLLPFIYQDKQAFIMSTQVGYQKWEDLILKPKQSQDICI